MALSLAFVLLGPAAKISAGAIQSDLRETWRDLPEFGTPEKSENTISFQVGEASVVLGLMPAPVPWSDLEGPCATSVLWPQAAAAVRSHTRHLIVTVTAETGPLERSALLTKVCAAIIKACSDVIGVYWSQAALLVPPRIFRDFAVEILPGAPPLAIWVDFRVGRNPQGKTSGFTQGLAALGLMEFETENSPEPPGELRQRFEGLIFYLIEHGPVIRDGDTIGESAAERIKVTYSPSAFGNREKVMRLDYSAATKPWWKFW